MSSIWIESNLWAGPLTEKENENDCETDRGKAKGERVQTCLPPLSSWSLLFIKFPTWLYQQSSNYEEEKRNKLRGRNNEFPTAVTAFMSPCLNQMANLSFFWESRHGHLVFTKNRIWAYLGHLIVHKKDELMVHKDYHLLIDSCAVDQVRFRSSLKHTKCWSGRMLR